MFMPFKWTDKTEQYLLSLYWTGRPLRLTAANFNQRYGCNLTHNAFKVKLQRLNGTRK